MCVQTHGLYISRYMYVCRIVPYRSMPVLTYMPFSIITYYICPHEGKVRRHLLFEFGDGAFAHPKTWYTDGRRHLVFDFGPGAIALNLMAALYPNSRRHPLGNGGRSVGVSPRFTAAGA